MARIQDIEIPIIPEFKMPELKTANSFSLGGSVVSTKELVRFILENPRNYEWTTQGLGMLRMYLDRDEELRLHIWDTSLMAESVSELHTHPWSFTSLVVAGVVQNWRYRVVSNTLAGNSRYEQFMCQDIHCGQGGGLIDEEPREVTLYRERMETYGEGQSYYQDAAEIHKSTPAPGTVTIIRREFGEDRDHAKVYWPVGEEWGTAEPKLAADYEVSSVVGNALKTWFE